MSSKSKKEQLLLRKEELLNEIKYYERRIEDARRNVISTTNICDDDSSDSEVEFTINSGPLISELASQQSVLQTCLQATQELTDVLILESEVNVMVDAPVLGGEPPVADEGLWREVAVQCRIDLVTFTMSFYVHKPDRMFGPSSYRSVQVLLSKLVQAKELEHSVLPQVKTPSEAVEVLRNYAHAHRARRSSLARLSEQYADALFMETVERGGYQLRCADVLRVTWTLQNRGSRLAPFHHKMSFDVEYMDECYVKVIAQAHRQLSDPSIDTDERTLLLAKIIDTCLEARKQAGPNESAESDMESQNSKRVETSDQDSEYLKDSEIMGPPKTVPKKSKPKGGNSMDVNRKESRKRVSDMDNASNPKKTKSDENTNKNTAYFKRSENKSKSNFLNEVSNLENKNDGTVNEESTDNVPLPKNHNDKENHEKVTKTKSQNPKSVTKNNLKTKPNVENDEPNIHTSKLSKKSGKGNSKVLHSENINKENSNSNTDTVSNKEKIVNEKMVKEKNLKSKNTAKNSIKVKDIEANNFQERNPIGNAKSQVSAQKNKPNSKNEQLNTDNFVKNPPITAKDNLNKKSKVTAVNNPKDVTNEKFRKNQLQKKANSESNVKTNKLNDNFSKNAEIAVNVIEDNLRSKNIRPDVPKNKMSKTSVKDNNKVLHSENIDKEKGNINNVTVPSKEKNVGKEKNNPKSLQNAPKNSLKIKENDTINFQKNNSQTITTKKIAAPNNKTNDKNKQFDIDNLVKNKNNPVTAKDILKDNNKQTNSKYNVLTNKLIDNLDKNTIDNSKSKNVDLQKKTVSKNPIALKTVRNIANSNLNTKIKVNNGKLRKSLSAATKAGHNKEIKQRSKIPQKRMTMAKSVKKNPLRISPRKLPSKLAAAQDSSKTSVSSLGRPTNIPRLMKHAAPRPKP